MSITTLEKLQSALGIMQRCEQDVRVAAKTQEQGSPSWSGFMAKADAYHQCIQLVKGALPLPHQERVIAEKAELDEKAHKLSDFIGNNPVFDTLDPMEQERLKVQNDIMWQYSEILGKRIAAFKP